LAKYGHRCDDDDESCAPLVSIGANKAMKAAGEEDFNEAISSWLLDRLEKAEAAVAAKTVEKTASAPKADSFRGK